jgi:outer membrane murein-binding lipoprotein Lpp
MKTKLFVFIIICLGLQSCNGNSNNDDLESQIQELDAKYNTLKDDCATLQNEISGLQTDINDLNQSHAHLMSNVRFATKIYNDLDAQSTPLFEQWGSDDWDLDLLSHLAGGIATALNGSDVLIYQRNGSTVYFYRK